MKDFIGKKYYGFPPAFIVQADTLHIVLMV